MDNTWFRSRTLACLIVVLLLKVSYDLYEYTKNFTLSPLPTHMWLYWENLPGKIQPGYIKLSLHSIIAHNKNNFNIHLLNEKSIRHYLPHMRRDLDQKLTIQQKTDYYRAQLLYHYGGIWVDADTIVMRNLMPIMSLLRTNEYVGYGCHYVSPCKHTGYPYPSNWVMASRRHSRFFTLYTQRINQLLDQHDRAYFQANYFAMEWNLLAPTIAAVKTKYPWWHYKHMSSICVDADRHGNILNNKRYLSSEPADDACLSRYLFVPIYNSYPGFPNWFRRLPATEVLKKPFLISKLLRYAYRDIDMPKSQEKYS